MIKKLIITELRWTSLIHQNKCNYFSFFFFFWFLHLLRPHFLHYGTSGTHEHISSLRPLLYWVDLLEVFHVTSNGMGGKRGGRKHMLFPLPKFCITWKSPLGCSFFFPPLYNELLYISIGFFLLFCFVLVFFWFLFVCLLFFCVFQSTCKEAHRNTYRCPKNALTLWENQLWIVCEAVCLRCLLS